VKLPRRNFCIWQQVAVALPAVSRRARAQTYLPGRCGWSSAIRLAVRLTSLPVDGAMALGASRPDVRG